LKSVDFSNRQLISKIQAEIFFFRAVTFGFQVETSNLSAILKIQLVFFNQALLLNLAFSRQNILIAHRRTVRPPTISLESSIQSNRYSTINQFISKAEQSADGLKSSRFFVKITANGWGCDQFGGAGLGIYPP